MAARRTAGPERPRRPSRRRVNSRRVPRHPRPHRPGVTIDTTFTPWLRLRPTTPTSAPGSPTALTCSTPPWPRRCGKRPRRATLGRPATLVPRRPPRRQCPGPRRKAVRGDRLVRLRSQRPSSRPRRSLDTLRRHQPRDLSRHHASKRGRLAASPRMGLGCVGGRYYEHTNPDFAAAALATVGAVLTDP